MKEGIPRTPSQPETPKGLSAEGFSKLVDVASDLQKRMAPMHERERTNVSAEAYSEHNDSGSNNQIMTHWITDGYAESFRDYVENPLHEEETINLDNPQELRELLEKIRPDSGKDTMH